MASLGGGVCKVMVAALCVGLARCEPPALSSQYGVPGNYAGPQGQGGQYQQQQQYQQAGLTNSYGAPLGDQAGHHGHDEQQDYIDSQPKSYEFGYAVKDAATGNDYGRRETSDGETVRGEYRVQLPDGRTQIVTYTADWRTGFHADVRYEGVAQYPDQYNNNNNNNINQGYPSANSGAYDYNGNNNVDAGYNGNQGGYNNYQGAANNYNSGQNYNYQLGSNAIEANYGPPPQAAGGSSYGTGQSLAPPPPQQYGVPFH